MVYLLSYGQVTPSAKLVWHPCYQDFQCARLEVPMNWNATHLNETVPVALALIKLPAVVPITDVRWQLSLFFTGLMLTPH